MGTAWNLSCGGFPNFRMAESEYEYLEQALPGFSKARLMVKAAGDSIRPLGYRRIAVLVCSRSRLTTASLGRLALHPIFQV